MSEQMPSEQKTERRLLISIARGFRGRCPNCGKGQLLSGYIYPIATCTVCDENLAPFQTADFAPYFVTFLIGLILMPIALALSLSNYGTGWLVGALTLVALVSALLLLPRVKGVAIVMLWALNIQKNQ